MRVLVNGVRLFFDVEGLGLAVDGARLGRQADLATASRGPSADHSIYKPYFQWCSDVAQVVSLDHEALARVMRRPEVTQWFTRPEGESRSFNFLPQLDRILCPTLMMGGKDDPMTPIQGQREIAAALAKEVVQFDEFENCGHGVVADVPDRSEALMRAFIAKAAGG
jgi:pimeloyl-ACP methyl ester carboxylesterase